LQFGEPYGEMAEALGRGWWVSVPDYEGPLASYGANILAGHVTLDSVQAVLSVAEQFGFAGPDKAKYALWGYSNGASATDLAIELAATYTPNLKFSGAAIGGLAPSSIVSGPALNGGEVAGLLVQGIIGITTQYPEQRQYLINHLKPSGPYNISEFFSAMYMSGWDSLVHYEYQDVYEYFINGVLDLLDPGMIAMFSRESAVGVHGAPNMPVFIYQAVEDGMAPINETDSVVKKFCDEGARVLYHRNFIGGHNDELTNGRQRALDYLGSVLDGVAKGGIVPPTSGCETLNLTFEQPPDQPITRTGNGTHPTRRGFARLFEA
jgi:hypothetical protein